MAHPLGRGREPPRPEGGSPETPGRVQPHSLFRESVTSVDLHRREPCFISPDEGPPCATLDHCWGIQKPGRRQGAKGTPAAPSATRGPLPGGRLASAYPAEDLPPGDALLRATQGGALLPDPTPQPPMRLPWRDGGCHAGAVVYHCDLIHLRPMVSVSLLLID